MGLEIGDEFRPITLLRIRPPPPSPLSRSSMNHGRIKLSDLDVVETPELENEEEEACECHTPKSSSQLKNNLLVCPPPPRKPRPTKRRTAPPPKFFHVPSDLASLFVPISSSSKKIRAS